MADKVFRLLRQNVMGICKTTCGSKCSRDIWRFQSSANIQNGHKPTGWRGLKKNDSIDYPRSWEPSSPKRCKRKESVSGTYHELLVRIRVNDVLVMCLARASLYHQLLILTRQLLSYHDQSHSAEPALELDDFFDVKDRYINHW